jgi:hypothetical protein
MEKRIIANVQFNTQYGWTDETACKWLSEKHLKTRYYNRRHPDYSGRFINYFQTALKRLRRNFTSLNLENGIVLYFGITKPRNFVRNQAKKNTTDI